MSLSTEIRNLYWGFLDLCLAQVPVLRTVCSVCKFQCLLMHSISISSCSLASKMWMQAKSEKGHADPLEVDHKVTLLLVQSHVVSLLSVLSLFCLQNDLPTMGAQKGDIDCVDSRPIQDKEVLFDPDSRLVIHGSGTAKLVLTERKQMLGKAQDRALDIWLNNNSIQKWNSRYNFTLCCDLKEIPTALII